MTKEEIKEKLDSLKYEIEGDMGECSYRKGTASQQYDKLLAQYELLEGIYELFGIEKGE